MYNSDRNILVVLVVANELVDIVKQSKRGCFMFKIDFKKAYDLVSYDFLDYMMNQMDFDDTWRKRVRATVCSSRKSVLVNGSPTVK